MNKKGISMVIFVIALAMILVLITAVTASYNGIINSTRMREFANEINTIQKAVDEYKFLNNVYPQRGEYTLDLSIVNASSKLSQFGSDITTMDFYLVDLAELGINKLNRGTSNTSGSLDVYAISKENGKVYYLQGVEIDNKFYYTLTDTLKEKLDI